MLIASGQYTFGGHLIGVAHGEWWRLVTSTFLHGSYLHIALNMYSLYYVGSILEIQIGRLQFLLLYFASGIAGSAGALVLSPLSPTVGASGAIFGVLGALFILERRGSIATGGQIAGLIVLNLVFTFALAAHISVGGHVGGLIGGIVLMSLFHRLRRSQTLYIVGATAGAVIVASVIVAYAKVRQVPVTPQYSPVPFVFERLDAESALARSRAFTRDDGSAPLGAPASPRAGARAS